MMSKSKQSREKAEREYYEKLNRKERWQEISGMLNHMKSEVSMMIRDCCRCSVCFRNIDFDEGYCERCHEESRLLERILTCLSELKASGIQEGIRRYTSENPLRPSHLP